MKQYRIAEIEKLIKELENEEDFSRKNRNVQYAEGISYCIERLKMVLEEIIDKVHTWNYQLNKGGMELAYNAIKELKQKIAELENKMEQVFPTVK
jgi:hypothetical protein